jgi:hypothetical protein
MKASTGRLRRIEQRRRAVRIERLTERVRAASYTVQQWHLISELDRAIRENTNIAMTRFDKKAR